MIEHRLLRRVGFSPEQMQMQPCPQTAASSREGLNLTQAVSDVREGAVPRNQSATGVAGNPAGKRCAKVSDRRPKFEQKACPGPLCSGRRDLKPDPSYGIAKHHR